MKMTMSFTREELTMLLVATEALRDERADKRDQTARVARFALLEGCGDRDLSRMSVAAELARRKHLDAAEMVGRLVRTRDRLIEKSKKQEREAHATS